MLTSTDDDGKAKLKKDPATAGGATSDNQAEDKVRVPIHSVPKISHGTLSRVVCFAPCGLRGMYLSYLGVLN